MNYDLFLIFERIIRLMSRYDDDTAQNRKRTSNLWLLLRFIRDSGTVTGSDVARRFMVKHPTATQLIDRAERLGLIRRTSDSTDRRVQLLELTDKGAAELERQDRLFDSRALQALKHLTADEHRQLLALMNKMAAGLEADALEGIRG